MNQELGIKNKRENRKSEGFTLIELLVVIAIVGILAGFLMVNFIGVRQRARDAQRKSDLRQIQSALELYRSDRGSYPQETTFPYQLNNNTPLVVNPSGCVTSSSLEFGTVIYMQQIPCDPLKAGIGYGNGSYFYRTPLFTTYILAACLENANDTDINTTTARPAGSVGTCSGKYYVLRNP